MFVYTIVIKCLMDNTTFFVNTLWTIQPKYFSKKKNKKDNTTKSYKTSQHKIIIFKQYF